MTQAQWQAQEALGQEILAELRALAPRGEPAGAPAQALCAKHEKWLQAYWPHKAYTRAAHLSLAESYAADERFRAYYDGGSARLRRLFAGCSRGLLPAGITPRLPGTASREAVRSRLPSLRPFLFV